jgi:DNA-nicking Smr family endonuclease
MGFGARLDTSFLYSKNTAVRQQKKATTPQAKNKRTNPNIRKLKQGYYGFEANVSLDEREAFLIDQR